MTQSHLESLLKILSGGKRLKESGRTMSFLTPQHLAELSLGVNFCKVNSLGAQREEMNWEVDQFRCWHQAMRWSSERPKRPEKGQPFCASTWLLIYCNVKPFPLCSFLWTTLLCTFSLFHLKCQFTAGSVLSAQPLLHVGWGISFTLSLFFLVFHLFPFFFYCLTSIPHFSLFVAMFPSSPPFSLRYNLPSCTSPSHTPYSPSRPPTPFFPPFTRLFFFSEAWHRFLIGSLIGHSAWDKGLIKQ